MWRGLVLLAACGSTSPPPVAPAAPVAAASTQPPVEDEHAKREEIVAAHRKLEEEQQDSFAATCTDPEVKHERCLPSCYTKAPPDPRAGKKLAGAVEITHLICKRSDDALNAGPFSLGDEIEPAKLALRPVRVRFPKGHKAKTWQAEVESSLATAQRPPLAKGELFRVTGEWRELVHPLTKERLRCVTVSQYARALRHPIDTCGADGAIACEASGNEAAHGLDVVHFRLAEARTLQAAGKTAECQEAALEAIAVARGLPRWRQYMTLNVAKWVSHPGYRTRFDGIMDEDALFAHAASLGGEAEAIHASCGGPAGAPTTPAQEQSFHTCW